MANKEMLLSAFNDSKTEFIMNIVKGMGAKQIVKSAIYSIGNLFSGNNINDSVLRAGAEFILDKAIEMTKKQKSAPKSVEKPVQLINLSYIKKTTDLQNKLHEQAIANIDLAEDKFEGDPVFTFGAHLWPVKGYWGDHAKKWNELASKINGRTYIVVALDETTDSEEYVRSQFSPNIELIFTQNTDAGESPSFEILLRKIPKGQNDIFIYAHSKGVRKHTYSSQPVKKWTKIMYDTVVFNFSSIVEKFSKGYKCFGSFRTFGDQPLSPKYRWHYAGTFFAIRSKYIPDDTTVKNAYGGVEAWPGSVFKAEEAWVELGDNRYVGAQYNPSVMFGGDVDNFYKEWLKTNE
jgi:hypothetical protein